MSFPAAKAMGCLGHTRSKDGTHAQSHAVALLLSQGCWTGGTNRAQEEGQRALPESLCCLAWRVCDGMARAQVHREGLASSLSVVTSHFCLLTGQPRSHYREYRLAGTRALCKSPGFVLLPLIKCCIFPAQQCRKDFSSSRRPW